MKRRISRYPAARPCDVDGPALPHIQVADDDDPASETATDIYYFSARGKAVAERIAREIAACGVALLYPGDRDVEVFVGPLHQVIAIGVGMEATRDE
ncbi:hypothetical protein [Pelomicrobium methylotrophicum]|uniref:Uncharacterized protein n=1 Tax=Pelomicrobium methylotrophicum TaxID=2602750 RepID=A0A5C7EK97_9PROT|nr:hypothetical protein [Pelomicrobium methylotrophicum]TXF11901.1 hypothetical protein FR698_07800 [Pelomicrobium methylotrophicum]